ncbi:MAG TPA: 50S ribosomal protein L24e [archaeon]|nr:50S ribosomal protein L24e [archaeon]
MKCSYCGKNIIAGTGKMYVKPDGTIFYFDASKCEKSFMMGREAKKHKWSRVAKK